MIKTPVKRLILALKARIMESLPTQLKNKLRLASNYFYDYQKFSKWSAASGNAQTQTHLKALITMNYHCIEKGLALKEPRIGFGTAVIQSLLANLWKYHENYGLDETGQIALNNLFSYYNFNLQYGLKNEQLYQELLALKEVSSTPILGSKSLGGVIEVTEEQILKAAKIDFRAFAESRYSIRHFAPIDVDIHLIEQAIAMAQKTPSVCNRQASKVYVFTSDEDKKKVLACQTGNRGFGEQASKVLIVTSELQHFIHIGERNQGWIDGGMFAMSLVYALHSLGLGTCCLNWSVTYPEDQKLRQISGIKNSEVVIMMIAVGHLPEYLKVAQSPRKNLQEVMVLR
ncbi:nitroreductase family protein [Nostoc sp.]|uniref:nitroreductase family protein n=1 Tax=Nostoc sp. TaxID=1180 RepID=UPI002FF99246